MTKPTKESVLKALNKGQVTYNPNGRDVLPNKARELLLSAVDSIDDPNADVDLSELFPKKIEHQTIPTLSKAPHTRG